MKRILLTNDDGIHSPGLWTAAAALEPLGQVVVVAPLEQNTCAGRSMPAHTEGRIHEEVVQLYGREWRGYAVDGTPAQVVQHAFLELMPEGIDLVVSGINYGENVGTGVTISGTVGAAFEAASFSVPALAISYETDPIHHVSHSLDVDFGVAGYFTHKFAKWMLAHPMPFDVDVVKVEVPIAATQQTPWKLTRQSRTRYYVPLKPERNHLSERVKMGYERLIEAHILEDDSDVKALVDGVVSVTPLSLDMTSRMGWEHLQSLLTQSDAG